MIRLVIFFALLSAAHAQTTAELRAHLIEWEGYSTAAYFDSLGHPTIGIGHRIQRRAKWLTPSQIETLFARDVEIARRGAERELIGFSTHPKGVRVIIISLVFAVGQSGFHEFYHLRRALNAHDYRAAAQALRKSLFARQIPDRAYAYAATLESFAPPRFVLP